MAVVNPGIFDNGDDDDGPITFKRVSSSSKNRPAPPKQESSLASVASVRSPKAVPLTPQRNGVTIASRPLHQKPHVASPNPRFSGYGQPNSSAERRVKNNTTDKGPLKRLHESDDSDDKPISFRKKNEAKLKRVDTGDEWGNVSDDDNKPLSLKMSSSKVSPSGANAVVLQKTVAKSLPNDSDGGYMPLCHRMSSFKVTPDRSEQPDDSDDESASQTSDDHDEWANVSDDDNKPLSLKMSSSKVSPSSANAVVLQKTVAKSLPDDSDGGYMPLCHRMSSSKVTPDRSEQPDDSDDESASRTSDDHDEWANVSDDDNKPLSLKMSSSKETRYMPLCRRMSSSKVTPDRSEQPDDSDDESASRTSDDHHTQVANESALQLSGDHHTQAADESASQMLGDHHTQVADGSASPMSGDIHNSSSNPGLPPKRAIDHLALELAKLSKSMMSLVEAKKKAYMHEFEVQEKTRNNISHLIQVLHTLTGFTRAQRVKAVRIIGQDDKKMELFFSMPDEDKIEFVSQEIDDGN